jgi:radical SAM protein with 4Fe4S-binding SPASM domain
VDERVVVPADVSRLAEAQPFSPRLAPKGGSRPEGPSERRAMSTLTFDGTPMRVYWELTRACPLACRHCRADALRGRAPGELTTAECEHVLASLAAAGEPRPHVVFTGGDPLARPDLVPLVRFAAGHGLGVSVAPSATPVLTRDVVAALKDAGVSGMSISVDGPAAAQHDRLRGVLGSFGWTLIAARRIVGAGVPLQINTLLCAETHPHLEAIAELVGRLGAARWSLFALVGVGRGAQLRALTAEECEITFRWLARNSPRWPFVTTTTEAPHYRRISLQLAREEGLPRPSGQGFGMRDGNGIMFIGADGDVTPSGFLPVSAGNVRLADPLAIYRESSLFRALRAPSGFDGRCGACAYRQLCGGSRARAWAASGNVRGEDPLCAWQPPGRTTLWN